MCHIRASCWFIYTLQYDARYIQRQTLSQITQENNFISEVKVLSRRCISRGHEMTYDNVIRIVIRILFPID